MVYARTSTGTGPAGPDDTLETRARAETGASLSPLIATSTRLRGDLSTIFDVAASHGTLYDRQNLGVTRSRVVLGPPGRAEFAVPHPARTPVINLAANSYLGIADDPRVAAGVIRALEQHGTHTGGSRLLCGTAQIHYELERRLARFMGSPGIVTYSSGYVTNVSVISALFGPGDLIVLDRHAHRSLYDGARLSKATLKRFAHNDVGHLDVVLNRTSHVGRRLVVVDGVYSMEGDVAPLPDLIEVTRRHGAFLLVDDAHAIGVLGAHGQGICEHFGIDQAGVDLHVGTLSKAIPSVGGFVATTADVAMLLRYTTHGTIFSAPLTPLDAAAAIAAIDIMEAEPERIGTVRANAALFRDALRERGVEPLGSHSAIVPILIGDRTRTLDVAEELLRRGIFLNPVIHPGIRRGAERLRCFVGATHSGADLIYAAQAIGEVLGG
jgi:8-amino-7-oxononanoate synthase